MKIINTNIDGLVVIEPTFFEDERGYFMESFKTSWFNENFPDLIFEQDNESKSKKGVLRGLHFQAPPYDQAKLVRVVSGKVLDVAIDLRKSSSTYGMHFSIILSGKNKKQFLIPRGFAHGFLVLSNSAIFSYKVDNFYSKEHEGGLIWNDPILNIDWNISKDLIHISKKDQVLENFNDFKSPFV
tara:strand:+ start:277 stop:828 length:552 start_codon:yes stop_codon:yes gene_type:complete